MDDLTVGRGRLAPYDDVVTVEDARIDHRVAPNIEHEDGFVADELGRKWVDFLDVLFGEDW